MNQRKTFYQRVEQKKRKAAYNTHNEMQNEISDHLETKGIKILDSSSPNVDLCWKKGDQFYFLEVKSIHDGNENEQIRRGIGQVAEYRYHFEEQGYIGESLAVTKRQKSTGKRYALD